MHNEREINLSQSDITKKRYNKISYLLISFHSGICTLSDLAIQYFFKDELKLKPGNMSQILSISFIPWMLKPLFGLITDLIPIFGYRRKYYIILCGLLNIFCWLYMSFVATTLMESVITLFFINVAVAFSTVLGEAIVVELSNLDNLNFSINENHNENDKENLETKKDHKAKDLISLFFILKHIGILVSSYLKGLLVDVMKIKNIFLISAFTPIMILIGGFIFTDEKTNINTTDNNKNSNTIPIKIQQINLELSSEKKEKDKEFTSNNINNTNNANAQIKEKELNRIKSEETFDNIDNRKISSEDDLNNRNNILNENNNYNSIKLSRLKLMKELIKFISKKEILIPIFFMIIMNSVPSYSDPLFYFLTNELKFSGNIMGQMAFASSFTAILSILLYKLFFKNVKFRAIIIYATILFFFFSYCAYILTSRINIKWGISDHLLSIFSSSAVSMIGEFLGMPLLSLACVKSPKNLEGTVYSFFMSAFNLGGIISYLMGSFMTKYYSVTSQNFKNLPSMISLCNILGLLPLFLFFLFNEKYFENKEIEVKNDDNNLIDRENIGNNEYEVIPNNKKEDR